MLITKYKQQIFAQTLAKEQNKILAQTLAKENTNKLINQGYRLLTQEDSSLSESEMLTLEKNNLNYFAVYVAMILIK